MNKSLALISAVFAISALMMSPAVMSISASNGNGGGDNAKAQSCEKANSNSQARNQNPNCDYITFPFTSCDTSLPAGLDIDEIQVNDPAAGDGIIEFVENSIGNHEHNGLIDSQAELDKLNTLIDPDCLV